MKRLWQIWLEDRKKLEVDYKKYLVDRKLIKTDMSRPIVLSHINKAFHNLDIATFIRENQIKINRRSNQETYSDAVIIFSYYAMYHAALAILARIGYKSRNHSATICILCKECKDLEKKDIMRIANVLERKNIQEIGEGQERREKASYNSSISFDIKIADITLEDARNFVNKIKGLLQQQASTK